MEERPNLKIVLTNTDTIIEIVGWFLLVAIWGFTLSNYQSLPSKIPIHYNGAGVSDGFGEKWIILTLPFIATVIFIGLTILNNYPHIFNYPTEIRKDNALSQYRNATRLIRYLKVIIVVIFGLIDYLTISQANGLSEGLGVWFLPLILGLVFMPIILYLIKSAPSSRK
jgi:uncharacterized membrane protein